MKVKIIILSMFFLASLNAGAQKLKTGTFTALKGQTVVNLQYDYSKMAVGKYKTEDKFLADGKVNRNKKKPGSGDEWAQKWITNKTEKFQPRFEDNLNQKVKKDVKFMPEASDAKYTLICRTLYTESGYNIQVINAPAWIRMVIDLVETKNPEVIIGSMEMKKLESKYMGGYDYENSQRIESCYDRAGDELGAFLNKNAFK